jgi:ABC-type nitrate/sulfonate/bicarbonate transport system substrate-binding protein
MTTKLTRRQALLTASAGALAIGAGLRAAEAAAVTLKQGYQTNMWGMPTYYLLHSGIAEKHGLKFEEFAVPSGNLTMQQQVARQVDLGTYAGPSFALGHEKGNLIAIAVIEDVGKTARLMVRKDLRITKVEDLKGKKIANQTGSSVGNILVDEILPKAGLKKGDYSEVRMNVDDMVAALAAKTVDAMANVEPYNEIAEAEGLATTLVDYYQFDKMPVFMAATPDIVKAHPDALVDYLKAWLDVEKDFKNSPGKVADTVYAYYSSKGYTMTKDTVAKALARVNVHPGWPSDLEDYMTKRAQELVDTKKLQKVPDWKTAFDKTLLQKAMS